MAASVGRGRSGRRREVAALGRRRETGGRPAGCGGRSVAGLDDLASWAAVARSSGGGLETSSGAEPATARSGGSVSGLAAAGEGSSGSADAVASWLHGCRLLGEAPPHVHTTVLILAQKDACTMRDREASCSSGWTGHTI